MAGRNGRAGFPVELLQMVDSLFAPFGLAVGLNRCCRYPT